MMGGIDEDAEWLPLLLAGILALIVIVAIVVVADLWRRARRLAQRSGTVADVILWGAAALVAVLIGVLRHWWGGLVVGSIVVLAWRAVEAALDIGIDSGRRSLTTARRVVLLVGVIATATAL